MARNPQREDVLEKRDEVVANLRDLISSDGIPTVPKPMLAIMAECVHST